MSARRWIVHLAIASGALALLLPGAALSLLYWIASASVHREVLSPDGTALVKITSRVDWLNPVIVAVEVVRSDGTVQSVDFDSRDMRQDITEKSYPIAWRTPSDFTIGDQWGSRAHGWRVRIRHVDAGLVIEEF